eukprot:1191347-Prorocentrum_minimum.AAC.1
MAKLKLTHVFRHSMQGCHGSLREMLEKLVAESTEEDTKERKGGSKSNTKSKSKSKSKSSISVASQTAPMPRTRLLEQDAPYTVQPLSFILVRPLMLYINVVHTLADPRPAHWAQPARLPHRPRALRAHRHVLARQQQRVLRSR